MPEIVGDFKVANVFDGRTDGRYFIRDRPPLPPGEIRDSVLAYLRQGAVLMMARSLDPDELDPARPDRVPVGLLTDGTWVWDASIAYYLAEHGLPPEPAFIEYLQGRNFHYEAPSRALFDAVQAAMREG